mgnify:CR=1 FL=1
MRTVLAITNPSGYPYQWGYGADYAPRDGYSEWSLLGNPITMRAAQSADNEFGQLIIQLINRRFAFQTIIYPYDFSDRERYSRRTDQRAPYGL